MKTPENWPDDIPQTSSEPAVLDKPFYVVSCRAQLTQTINFPINFTKIFSWFRLVRITAFVYRTVRIFRKSVKNSQCRTSLPPYLTATEFKNAKTKLLQFVLSNAIFSPGSLRRQVRTPTAMQQPHQKNNTVHLPERMPLCLWSLGEVSTWPWHKTPDHIRWQASDLTVAHSRNTSPGTSLCLTTHSPCSSAHLLDNIRSFRHSLRQNYDCRSQHVYGTQPQMSVLPGFRFPADRTFPIRATGLDVFGPFASKTADQYHERYALTFTCLTNWPLFHHPHLTSVEYRSASYVPAKTLFIQSLDLRR